jgi:heptaprenyl diphosphate synthase
MKAKGPLTASSGKGAGGEFRRSLAILGALCQFLSALEYLVPKPLPFMRLGLANLPLMVALDVFPFRAFILLAAVKVAGQALITGTLFSYVFLFSLAGTAASALSMYALRRLLGRGRISFIGLGAAGAALSNLSQLALARLFLFRESAVFIAPPFLAAGLISGTALGLFCEQFSRRSQWYALHVSAPNTRPGGA